MTLKTDARNVRSRTAIQRLGAKHDGILRAHMPAFDGAVRDTAFYSILLSEWPDVRARLERLSVYGPEEEDATTPTAPATTPRRGDKKGNAGGHARQANPSRVAVPLRSPLSPALRGVVASWRFSSRAFRFSTGRPLRERRCVCRPFTVRTPPTNTCSTPSGERRGFA